MCLHREVLGIWWYATDKQGFGAGLFYISSFLKSNFDNINYWVCQLNEITMLGVLFMPSHMHVYVDVKWDSKCQTLPTKKDIVEIWCFSLQKLFSSLRTICRDLLVISAARKLLIPKLTAETQSVGAFEVSSVVPAFETVMAKRSRMLCWIQ